MKAIQHIEYLQKQLVLFPSRLDENIPDNDPVRLLDQVIDKLDISSIEKLYHHRGRRTYHPRMLLKVILYAYMNNIYSCRKIEKLLSRDIHFMWLSGNSMPDFITINRFRNRVKDDINKVFSQLVQVLVEEGFLSLDVAYIDGTKIESKANKYTFVWRKTVEHNREKLQLKIKAVLEQVEESIIQDKADNTQEAGDISSSSLQLVIDKISTGLSTIPATTKEEKKTERKNKKLLKDLQKHKEKLEEYEQATEKLNGRNSYSKTDPDATFMRMKEDAMNNGQTKPGYNLQIGTNKQFITDFSFYPNPTDTLTLIPFLHSYQERHGSYPNQIVADSGYGSEENYAFMRENDMDAYVKYNYFHKEQKRSFKNNPFLINNLYYNKDNNYFVCPMGQHMRLIGTKKVKSQSGYQSTIHRYEAENCESCPLKNQCTKAKGNRVIDVNHTLNAYKQEAREKLISQEGLDHRSKRPIEPEAVFGQMKYNMQYKRFRHFGLDKITMDFSFFAMAFNLKKMCKMVLAQIFGAITECLETKKWTIQLFILELKIIETEISLKYMPKQIALNRG